MNRTERFGFTILDNALDQIDAEGWKFTDADRVQLDRLLLHAVERHRHDGSIASGTTPPGPDVTLGRTGGILPADREVHYRYALVDRGQEDVASQITTVRTYAQLSPPSRPAIMLTTGGSLLPGSYRYAVSAWTGTDAQETTLSPWVTGELTGTAWNLVMGGISPQASGWNLYRQGPTDQNPVFLTSARQWDYISYYTDDGAASPNRLRSTPTTNTTSTTSTATITVPLPPGLTCKIYRSFDRTNWNDSLLTWTADPSTVDTGHATTHGSPLTRSGAIGGAPKVNLATATDGDLPPSMLSTRTQAMFNFHGPVLTGMPLWQWVSEFDAVQLLTLRANLGRGSTPAVRPVRVALAVALGDSRFQRLVDRHGDDIEATIPVGHTIGPLVSLTDVPGVRFSYAGCQLRPVIKQSGGGATPTDYDLTVTVTMEATMNDTRDNTWEPT